MSDAVLICGSVAFDTIAVFDGRFKEHILPDRIHALSVSFLVPQMRREFGGCAGNIAYNLKLLGGQPLPVASVGSDAEDYLKRFAQFGIDTRHIKVHQDMFTAQCFITSDLDDNQISAFHPGAMDRSADNDIGQTQAKWAIVAPDSKAGMMAHVDRFAQTGTPFLFDLGQAMPLFDGDDLRAVFDKASALAFNDYEASVVEQRTGLSVDQIAQKLQAVVVTRGGEGATLYTQGQKIDIEPVKPEAVVDPTGCGDAHRAGLLFGLTRGWSWEKACMLGNVMGSIKIAHRGPQNHVPTREQIARIMQQNFGVAF
ncbi:MAG: carbohydrate kinase family protein [Burkholderiaceae bacterium]|nr:carbohydrate kinase family protein [Burkholderiaceae bacterium]MCD8517861.1 carbohydrate kinase family protein [Burkholderiaceae bacterium]MCD8535988.1 carbohydrate kinase family protein [Burkholderiaceae bacterium]MCD8564601.1 carbohydrate kinase family protein [Burkholderiaceae bacterium]